MACTSVRVLFEIGHEASIRAKKTPEGFTHDWELFVRGVDNAEIHHFVEKVIFYLHETFQNPKRIVKEPPYVVRESGYAGFSLHVDIYFKSKLEPTKARFPYHLSLQTVGPPVSNKVREEYVFNNPPEDFRRKLIKGGGFGVGEESTSSHHLAINSSQSDADHKNSLKNKSPLDLLSSKKLKKENTPRTEEKLNANDPFSIFGQPINPSKIPLVSKSNSKLISEKISQSDKQVHSSKPPKHNISSHKEKDKDKDRDKEKDRDKDREKDREKEKHKTKDRDKEKDKSLIKKSKDESMKKEKSKEDKMKVLKSSKEDSKKNAAYHDEKTKEKLQSIAPPPVPSVPTVAEKSEKELKAEKKEKEKKHKEEKKQKSKDKHNKTSSSEKKENIDVTKENYSSVGDRLSVVEKPQHQQLAAPSPVITKDENVASVKEEKKGGRKIDECKDDRLEAKSKDKSAADAKKLYANNGSVTNSLLAPTAVANSATVAQSTNNGVADSAAVVKKEEKHKHHKHKKDKSKKDSKRDKEEKKEKLKESKSKSTPPAPPPISQQPVLVLEITKVTPKLESPKQATKKPLKHLFELSSDKSDSDSSSLDDDQHQPPQPLAPVKAEPILPEVQAASNVNVKEEPTAVILHPNSNHNNVHKSVVVDEPPIRNAEPDLVPKKKKSKKSAEEKEAKKRKRKSKDKGMENVVVAKMGKYEAQTTEHSVKTNTLIEPQQQLQSPHQPQQPDVKSESRQTSLSPVGSGEPKFTDEYITKLKELQRKIMTLEDNSGLQRIVQVVAETGQYEITTKTFDFDLCTLDESIVQRLSDFFLP